MGRLLKILAVEGGVFIIRDSTGIVAGSGADQVMYPHDALHTEALACIQGMTAAMNGGMAHVAIESDCQILINALNSTVFDRSHIGVLVRDSMMMATLNFQSCSFNFCRRECNKSAHAMAALGLSGAAGNGLLWVDVVLDDVFGLVANYSAVPTV